MGTAPCIESINGILEGKASGIAEDLGLPIGFAGKPFILPSGPYLFCEIARETAKAASLGPSGALRIDGNLVISACAILGDPSKDLPEIAESLAASIPKGHGLEYSGSLGAGGIVFKTPEILEPKTDSGRMNIEVVFGFCAIIFKTTRQS